MGERGYVDKFESFYVKKLEEWENTQKNNMSRQEGANKELIDLFKGFFNILTLISTLEHRGLKIPAFGKLLAILLLIFFQL